MGRRFVVQPDDDDPRIRRQGWKRFHVPVVREQLQPPNTRQPANGNRAGDRNGNTDAQKNDQTTVEPPRGFHSVLYTNRTNLETVMETGTMERRKLGRQGLEGPAIG